MKKKPITDFLPKEEPRTYIQGRVSKSVVDSCKLQMKKDDITWNELLEAVLKAYLAERK